MTGESKNLHWSVFLPKRNKTKTNWTLYLWFFPHFEQIILNCLEFWLVHQTVCSCCCWSNYLNTAFSTVIWKPLYPILETYSTKLSFHDSFFLLHFSYLIGIPHFIISSNESPAASTLCLPSQSDDDWPSAWAASSPITACERYS